MHKPIIIKDLSLPFTKIEDFSATIHYGDRIILIGRNGAGKSTLLKSILKQCDDVQVGYVPQMIKGFEALSGGERFNAALTKALSVDPEMLLLDEPTNHLDSRNKKSLLQLLKHYPGTLVIATHDMDLMEGILWHIKDDQISIFKGSYEDYKRELELQQHSLEQKKLKLNQEKKYLHEDLMDEQVRAKKSRLRGEKRTKEKKWPAMVAKMKEQQAAKTTGDRKKTLGEKRQDISERLKELQLPEVIKPKFSLETLDNNSDILVVDGTAGYHPDKPVLKNINLALSKNDRLAITGQNGSGKTTLIKAILGDPSVWTSGEWIVPKKEHIGHLDQHYKTLDPDKTVLEHFEDLLDKRKYLNDYLFRTDEQVNTKASCLSEGEKARLSLAQIGAHTPRLLILDELTNNLDLETKEHVIQVLRDYPGTLIVISHEQGFLDAIGVTQHFSCL
ncbi:MAG: ABC-F family ATP-binding cassette domain-containing protein [Alphaproteobacteria bacterium]|nr:MAG: ABC-F family ATP-binding cassette domain-containing protein [Alphaproteobacteria bacterium]